MWEVSRGAVKLAAAMAFLAIAPVHMTTTAVAQTTTIQQNISGFNLPGVTLPQGHDEVRAADGTTCRSAVGGNGAYVDMGLIGNPERTGETEGSLSAYGRLVVPLGAMNRKRIDCTKLYDLEVARLEMELKLMQMGLGRGMAPVGEGSSTSDASPIDGTAPKAVETTSSVPPKPDEGVKVAALQSNKSVDDDPSDDWADDGWTKEGLEKKKN